MVLYFFTSASFVLDLARRRGELRCAGPPCLQLMVFFR
ncbi:hypothetical protein AALP_AAs48907U000100 [Arabis alpina]|uniref:Uncharacterized protein n=1 Tax=Arabis alpina TaxID=50452 RepID=A0A087FY03_ARAAL|nr:hypothetical protein AALP_AAs48907U000100 [Arabis alpina]